MVASIVLPASSLVAYRLPPVLSRHFAPSCATCSKFQSRPYRFPVSSGAFRPTFPSRSYRFPAKPRDVRPTFTSARPVSRCVVRYSLGVCSRPSRLPFCPVSRFLRSSLFLSFDGYYCTKRTTLLFRGLLGKPSY